MKKIILMCVFSIFILQLLSAQEFYYILKIQGEISTDGIILKVRDKIFDTTKITFSSRTDNMLVLHSTKGTLTIKPMQKDEEKSELYCYVKENILPVRKPSSTRSPIFFDNTSDFKEYFSLSPFLLLPNNTFYFNPNIFNISSNSFFYIRYTLNGELINKKLKSVDNKFIINKHELFTVDGESVDPLLAKDFKLYYFTKTDTEQNSELLSEIVFSLPDIEEFKGEVNLIKSLLTHKNEVEVNEEVLNFIYAKYGNYEEKELKSIIQ